MTEMRFSLAEAPEHADAEKGRLLFAGPCDFLKGVVAMDGMPPSDRLEVCFAGRSNVRTQEINFFTLGDAHYLVDVPGYGFANAPVTVVGKWQRLLKAYLSGRPSLRRVFLLIDGRHGAKAVDEEIMELLDRSAVTFQVVITKADKPRAAELEQAIARTREVLAKHPAAYPEIVVTSAEKGEGIATLRSIIATMV
jgi:GTP-binding protein